MIAKDIKISQMPELNNVDGTEIIPVVHQGTNKNIKSQKVIDKILVDTKKLIPTELPANGGNSKTVNGHTVESNVPSNAKFTDTVYNDTQIKSEINTIKTDMGLINTLLDKLNGEVI